MISPSARCAPSCAQSSNLSPHGSFYWPPLMPSSPAALHSLRLTRSRLVSASSQRAGASAGLCRPPGAPASPSSDAEIVCGRRQGPAKAAASSRPGTNIKTSAARRVAPCGAVKVLHTSGSRRCVLPGRLFLKWSAAPRRGQWPDGGWAISQTARRADRTIR